MPVTAIQGGGPGHFKHVSITYNHAHRLRLEKNYYIQSFLEAPTANGFLNRFWVQTTVLISAPVLRMNTGTMCIHVRKQLQQVDAVEQRHVVNSGVRGRAADRPMELPV
jgi:hypothetical protein